MEEDAINWNESREGNMSSLDRENGREIKCKKKKKDRNTSNAIFQKFQWQCTNSKTLQCMGSQSIFLVLCKFIASVNQTKHKDCDLSMYKLLTTYV